jgi:hypothetical protein
MVPRRTPSPLLAALVALILAGPAAGQTIRYVSPTGGHISPYNTWARAATNLQTALSAAQNNNIVLVTDGVYRVSATLNVTRRIVIRSVNGPETTVIEGNGAVRLMNLNNRARIEGFTLRHGRAGGTGAAGYGGALYVNNGTLSNLILHANSAAERGGAVYFYNRGGLLTHSRLFDNESPFGAGVYARQTGIVSNSVFHNNRALGPAGTGGGGAYLFAGGLVTHCRFEFNTAGNDGGGVLMESAGTTVRNSRFFGNTAGDWGGGLAVYFNGGLVQHCLIVSNRADEGGGVYFHQSGSLENSTVTENTALLNGGGIVLSGGGTSVNTIVHANFPENARYDGTTPRVRFTLIDPLPPAPVNGGGNLSTPPLFLYAPDGIFHLRPASPAINAGTNLPGLSARTDLHGSPAILGGTVDLGAYEFGPLVVHPTATPRSGLPPLAVDLEAVITGSNLTSLGYAWDVDHDGTPEQLGGGPLYTTVYTNGGTFSVRVDATNQAAETASSIRTNLVFAFLPHFVAPGGGHSAPFTSWSTAATNLEAAVAIAGAGGKIFISNGIYQLRRELIITQALAVVGVNGPAVTTVRGSGTSRVLRIRAGVNISGLTLREGRATGMGDAAHGAGIFFDGGGIATNMVLTDNRADGDGGGAYASFGGQLAETRLEDNRASRGGGLTLFQGGQADRLILIGNRADDRGGGAFLAGNTILRNSVAAHNRADGNGGGVALFSSGSTLQNCTLVSNQAVRGGGLLVEDGGNIQNNIVFDNNAAPPFANWFTNTLIFDYGSFFQHNCLTPTNGLPGASGNITNPPFFTATPTPYSLDQSSPCVDAALFLSWMPGARDFVGATRIAGNGPDIGALERIALALSIASPSTGLPVPFRNTIADVAGTAIGLTGEITFTNHYPGGVVTGVIPAASNWAFSVHMPRHGDQIISVTGTDSVGNAVSSEITIRRKANQLFVPAR